MDLKDILEKKSEVAIEDILSLITYQKLIEEISSEKYPNFYKNQKNINSSYRHGLTCIIDSFHVHQITIFGKLLSESKNYASLKEIHKLINRNSEQIINLNSETKNSFAHMSSILKKLKLNKKETINKILNTRNNAIAHSYNEDVFFKEGGSSKISENNEVISDLTQWAIQLSYLIMSSEVHAKWNHDNISAYILEQIPLMVKTTVEHLLSFNKGLGKRQHGAKMMELIPIEEPRDT